MLATHRPRRASAHYAHYPPIQKVVPTQRIEDFVTAQSTPYPSRQGERVWYTGRGHDGGGGKAEDNGGNDHDYTELLVSRPQKLQAICITTGANADSRL